MRRFRFRLARLESVRRAALQEAETTLASSLRRVDQCARERSRLEEIAKGTLQRCFSGGSELDGELVRRTGEYLEALGRGIHGARGLEAQARRDSASCLSRYTEASRGYRVLTKLHERRRRLWREEVTREEQKTLDELHLARVARVGRQEGSER